MSFSYMFSWGMTVIVHMARVFPKYQDCEGTEKCLQCSDTWKVIVPSIIPEP